MIEVYRESTYMRWHMHPEADKAEERPRAACAAAAIRRRGQDSDSAGPTARTPGSVASLADSTPFPLTCVLKLVRLTHHILASSSRLSIIERAEDVGHSQLQQTVD